ncbi:Hypothetical protein I595_1153 [Croceitalea dokdonensis DOKDO 023]|uniref:Uncharacterized protein n=1 Tax=Croceitalea dokdonensis DOKDO 023 TaxID=1300341 RepID=A0A0P7B2X1_9FLAO|nr:Hypothetical protein I595_1153 [Croceitalea dokdonensis DOKDO 023]
MKLGTATRDKCQNDILAIVRKVNYLQFQNLKISPTSKPIPGAIGE